MGVLVAGCAGDEPIETAQPGTTAVTAPTSSADPDAGLWDPCTLPDSALSAAGIDTSTEEKDVARVDFEGWNVCAWKDVAKTYTLTMYSTASHAIEDVRARSDYTDFLDTTVSTFQALQSRPAGSAHDYSCYISLEVPWGMVEFNVLNRHSAKNAGDPCVEVRRQAEALVGFVPNH
ncbi:DUF3558 domain-containing protein [Nocardia neocaledoniensis]|uniref:DUF3558 domain-containing protein n=1 Tax=Nocardia neocaledoniensis TaxID=236511 RepID=UPI0033F505C3